MLQIDHVYEFLYQELFKDFEFQYLKMGVPNITNPSFDDIHVFMQNPMTTKKIFFYDQEPLIQQISNPYFEIFSFYNNLSDEKLLALNEKRLPYAIPKSIVKDCLNNSKLRNKKMSVAISEISTTVDFYCMKYNLSKLYYFFHGFAALDWYRGYYALNYNKSIIKDYKNDFISFNRLIVDDRSYRIYFISVLS